MRLRRRTFMAGMPAAAATAALPACLGRARAAAAEPRNVSFTSASALPAAERARHERYMAEALDLAEADPPPPYTALIVDRSRDEVICRSGGRHREARILHAELVALMECGKREPRENWPNFTLYATGEPCPMCMSAAVWSRVPEVVYAISAEAIAGLGLNQFRLDSPAVAASAPFYSGRIVGGVLEARAYEIFRPWAESRK